VTEEGKRKWDVLLGAIAPFLTVVAIIVGIWQFDAAQKQREKDERTSRIAESRTEFERRLWLQKLETYGKIADVTGEVLTAQEKPGAAADAASQKFEQAYWGTMVLVEDKTVESAMIEFRRELRDLRTGFRSDTDRLKDRALILMKACRESLEADVKRLKIEP
jgi:hypothetical protein